MTESEFDSLPSWSVDCNGDTFDDARAWHGIWFYRHIVTREIRPVPANKHVSPICRNDTPQTVSSLAHAESEIGIPPAMV